MALSAGTFQSAGGAVSDLFSAGAYRIRAAGNELQSQQYERARDLSLQNEQFTKTSTAIKTAQSERGVESVLGGQASDVASSGFEASGSALDILRDSASQGALTTAVIGQQGQIDEAGYREQAESFHTMSQSALLAARSDREAARGATISAVIRGVTSLATLFPSTGGGR